MPYTGQQVVDQVKQQGFDNTDTEILGWVDERQKEMVAAARARRKSVSAGPTVAGQGNYTLPEGIVEIFNVRVGTGVLGPLYTRASASVHAAYEQAALSYDGAGFFVPWATNTGTDQFWLVPYPTEAGHTIFIESAIEAETLALADDLFIPDQFVRYLRYGAMATGWDVNAEEGNTSDRYEARFEQGVERYRRWVARRFRGSGPAQIRVKGLNA
jgi:hypothetical protein